MSIIIDDDLREMLQEENETFQQESMMDHGFNTLHNEIMQALKDKCRVTNVVRGMLGKDKFDVISNDDGEDKIKVVVSATGSGCELTGRNDKGGLIHRRNVSLSRAKDMILDIFRNPKEAFAESANTSMLNKFLVYMEADEDAENTEGEEDDDNESLEDIEKDMENIDSDDNDDNDDNDTDDVEIGTDTSDVQNEYDEEELTTLNKLIADEQEAIQGYFEASEKSKHDILIRLYSDIGKEERFHTEQLLYAKAELTGEKYEPSDPKVKEEYEELLAGGMDEETAMYTIADKHNIGIDEDDVDIDEEFEEIKADIDSIEESFTQTIANCELLMVLQESGAYKNHNDLREAYNDFAETVFVQEAMDNVSTKQGSEILGTNNPFIIIGRIIKTIYNAILSLVKKLKNWINKRRIKQKRVMAWIKKNGIKGLFSEGVKLYFWSDETGTFEVSDAVAFMRLCMGVTDYVAKAVKVQPPRVNNGKASGNKFPSGMGNKTIVFSNINDGKHKIDGVVFTKTKVIVTDHNQSDLENMFFGVTADTFVTSKDDGKTYEHKSMNIYNALQYILEWCGEQLRVTNEWLEKTMIPEAGKQKGIAYTNPTVYKDCIDAMKSVSKGYTKLTKCLTSDIDTCMKLDQGLLNAVNQIDQSGRNPNNPHKDITVPEDSQARDSEGNVRISKGYN